MLRGFQPGAVRSTSYTQLADVPHHADVQALLFDNRERGSQAQYTARIRGKLANPLAADCLLVQTVVRFIMVR